MLNGNELGDRIVNALRGLSEDAIKDHRTVWRTIATAIVEYFKEKAEVYAVETRSTATFQPSAQGTFVDSTQTVNGKIK